MDFATSGGTRIACRIDGEPGRPVVVLSNSLASDHRMWNPQMPLLERQFRVVRYDKRGHGASEAGEGDYTIELLARDCLAVMDHFEVDKAHFVGLSIGGMAGQWLGAEAPERFLSLMLCDTTSEMPVDVWTDRIRQAREEGMAGMVDSTLTRWFTEDYRNRRPPELALVREMIEGTQVAGYAGCAAAIRDMKLTPLLERIHLPTRIVVGEEDKSTPVERAEALTAAISNADLVVIPEAAHLPNIEQADIFNEALMEFLGRQTSAAGD